MTSAPQPPHKHPNKHQAQPQPRRSILARGSYSEALRIGEILRKETVGGALLVAAAVIALIWANSPASDSYFALRDITVGYEPWHLELSLGAWAADGLLAVFFFLVGLELKREFVAGDLRQISTSIVPVLAAAGGVLVPAVIYAVVNLSNPDTLRGWAIPTATDIAFAVAVLAVIGSHLPSALRIFLLTLAVVDDLIAISIIAFFYSSDLQPTPLLLALIPLAVFTFLVQKYRRFFGTHAAAAWLILLPLGFAAWALVHASGIHATVAGVLLGFAVPVIRSQASGGPEAGPGLAEIFEHRFRPISAGIAVPVFAFFSAGVAIGGWDGFVSALADPVALGIILALVLGKAGGHPRRHLAPDQDNQGQAGRLLPVDRHLWRGPAGRHRFHRVPAGGRAQLRPGQPPRRPCQGGHPDRVAARCLTGQRYPPHPEPAVPAGRGIGKSGR